MQPQIPHLCLQPGAHEGVAAWVQEMLLGEHERDNRTLRGETLGPTGKSASHEVDTQRNNQTAPRTTFTT